MRRNNTQNYWRRTYMFSAFLLLITLVLVQCRKPENMLGKDVYDPDALLDANGVDTFQLITYCELADSVISRQPATVMLGSYNDPVFGRVDGSFYAQFRLEANNPNFGELSTIFIDSVVMSMEYRDFYGEPNDQQRFEVYRVSETLFTDSVYYNFSTVPTGSQSLVPVGKEMIKPEPAKRAIVGSDTLAPQLRIHLDTNYAWEILNASASGTLANNEVFLETFKGLYVKTNNPMWASGQGSVLFLDFRDPDSKITVYYRQEGEPKRFTLLANNSCVYFNHVEFSHAGTAIQQTLDNPALGMNSYYAQAGILRAKVEFPGVSNLSEKTIVHRAMLYLPLSYFNGNAFFPSLVGVASIKIDGQTGQFALGTNQYSTAFKRYSFTLTSYIQDLIKGRFPNTGIYISPSNFNSTVERIIFNGPNSTNKDRPKLVITYTEY
jgi:hypothetical protein